MRSEGISEGNETPARALDRQVLADVLARRRATGESLGRCMAAHGWRDEAEGLRALAAALGVRFVDLGETQIDPEAGKRLPADLLQRARAMPLAVTDGRLLLAMEDPLDFDTVDCIRTLTGKTVDRAVCTAADMDAAMQVFHGQAVERMLEHFAVDAERPDQNHLEVGQLREMASEPTVVNLVNLLIVRAVRDRASDIHVEPFEAELKVRYRIDGVLHEMPSPPKHLHPAIVSRVKIMADMNIAERFVPQDGHIELNVAGHEVDVRVATIPTIHGECIVLRLLDKSSFLLGLDDLGFEPETVTPYRRLLNHPHGIILVCGPTGSGKTTTLYASLASIYTPERKFITIEDPVEYELPGVNQIAVRPKRGLTFANGLRSIVRQDPDIIMVGEIRDGETADIAVRAALTGHLVFSTLHTNDACEAIPRLLDMGVEPYLAASALRGIVAQRLVRTLCPACKERRAAGSEELERLRRELGQEVEQPVLHQAVGCRECKETGFRGRSAIAELLVIDDDLRDAMLRHASAAEIRRAAGPGMLTMRQAGCRRVVRGLTTAEEVLRVTQADEYSNGRSANGPAAV
ncbi:MAG: type II/IV secretion system protein [Candidatus Brocadiaceae bacterium]|nr:type II/IV secretion system protein [Candidatus Brocadiaceae bacterium]